MDVSRRTGILNVHCRACLPQPPASLFSSTASARQTVSPRAANTATRGPRSEHLRTIISLVTKPPQPHRVGCTAITVPAAWRVASPGGGGEEAPKASAPGGGESVLGVALIWMALHWRQTKAGGGCCCCCGRWRRSSRPRGEAALLVMRGNWPRIVGRWLSRLRERVVLCCFGGGGRTCVGVGFLVG